VTIEARLEELWAAFLPPPRLTVSEWADQYRVLAPESSAEPGPWSTRRTPYLKAIMDAYTDPAIDTVVVMASSQSAKTEAGLNCLGRAIHLDPGPALWIAPTLEMAKATAKDRLSPMVRLCPELASRVATPRAKHGASTILHRTFPGGQITLGGANSPAGLASRPIRYLYLDEVDRYPASAGTEGDPISLAVARTRTFARRKVVVVSSPTVEGASRIADWYAVSDQRRYWLPCPRCGDYFVPTWDHVKWTDHEAATAHVVCPHCGGRIEDQERPAMVAAGEWRATGKFEGVAGSMSGSSTPHGVRSGTW
jgi:phage terminase large subunit GpA-like protein